MNLRDDADQARFRAGLRAWLRQHGPGRPVHEPPEPAAPPGREWGKLLHAAGYTGLTWPRTYGGQGLSPIYQGIFAEESALAGVPEHHNVIGLNMVGPTLITYGTAAQQERHLAPVLAGEQVFCQGFSEPEAGSDLAAIRTVAVADGDGWVVTGEKIWSSYAPLADYCLLLARTEPGSARHHGLGCFILDLRTPGVAVRPLRMITGDAVFGQIVLEDARLPADAVVGTPGDGWRVAMATLAHERGTFGITLTARLAVQFERLLACVRLLGAAGDPHVRRTVARLHVDLEALRWTGYRALSGLARTGTPGPESTVLKLHWSSTHQRLVAHAEELVGRHAGRGDETVDRWARYWMHERLRCRGNSIEGGTSEILRGIVAERVAGLPRSR